MDVFNKELDDGFTVTVNSCSPDLIALYDNANEVTVDISRQAMPALIEVLKAAEVASTDLIIAIAGIRSANGLNDDE